MSPFPIIARLAAAAGVAACALAAPAHAAYAPRMSVALDPPTAGGPVAMTLELTQSASEEATRSLRVALPGFGAAAGARSRAACTGVAASSGTCPAESRIGSASSSTSFGAFAGGIFFAGQDGERTRVLAVLSNPAIPLVLDQRFAGTLSPVAGGLELAFDDLPGATATRLRIALEGDGRALVTAPAACGARELLGRLTSHGGQRAEQRPRVAIGGCAGAPPVLTNVRVAPATVRAGSPTAVALALAEPAFVRVLARRARTRAVRTLRRATLPAGRHTLRNLARTLPPGLWILTVRASDPDGTVARTLTLRVLPRPR